MTKKEAAARLYAIQSQIDDILDAFEVDDKPKPRAKKTKKKSGK
jgi:hypothetical protein